MKKSFNILIVALMALFWFASCANNLSDSSEDSEYGTIVINTNNSRSLDVSSISKAVVSVKGNGITNPISKTTSVTNGSGTVTLEDVPVGANRIITVQGQDSSGNDIEDALLMLVLKVNKGVNSDIPSVTWETSRKGYVYNALFENGQNIRDFTSAQNQAIADAIPEVDPTNIDLDSIVSDWNGGRGTLKSKDNYIKAVATGTVKVTATNMSGYSYKISDGISTAVTISSDSETKELTCAKGSCYITVYDSSSTEVGSEEVLVGKDTTTTVVMEYGTGVDISDKTIIFVKADSAPDIWAWESNGVALSDKAGGKWNVSTSATKLISVTSDYMASSSGWYMIDYSQYATGKEIHFKLNWGDKEYTGKSGTFWFDGSSSLDTNPSPVVSGVQITVNNPAIPQKPAVSITPSEGEISLSGSIKIKVTSENTELTSASATINGITKTLVVGSNSFSLSELGITEAGITVSVSASATNSEGSAKASASLTTVDKVVVPDTFTWDNANVYFVIQDRFYDGDSSNNNSYGRMSKDELGKNIGTFHGGDIKGLTQKLDYLNDLGINAIWITAPYEQAHGWTGGGSGDFAHYAYHGYYPLDYTMIDKNMGTVEEFRTFVTECHKRGIRVVMDVVMNHTGYATLQDMQDFKFYPFTNSSSPFSGFNKSAERDLGWKISVSPSGRQYHGHNDVMSNSSDEWKNGWWGVNWVRCGYTGFESAGSSELTLCLDYLPDVRTDSTSACEVPPILKTKWFTNGDATSSEMAAWRIPAADSLRSSSDKNAPAVWIEKWLAAWVEEFGIDGFRCDTAKHVDYYRWAELKNLCKTALKTWRASSRADEYAKDWNEDFWMTGEAYGHTYVKNEYSDLYNNGFDTLLDFTVAGSTSMQTFTPNNMPAWTERTGNRKNLLYISSHDTGLGRWSDQKALGTQFILTPGPIQIYYGDETSRAFGDTCSDPNQGTRSDMNWSEANGATAKHWGKLGTFRKFNPAVGAGSLSGDTRTYDDNKVVISTSSSTVSVPYSDGTTVYNWYDGKTATVSGGKATFSGSSASTSAPVLCSDRNPANYGVTF